MNTSGFRNILRKASGPFTTLSLWVKQKLGRIGEPHIMVYNCYGNSDRVIVTGVVREDKGLRKPREGQGAWKNMTSMIARYMSNVIPGVRVQLDAGGSRVVLETDGTGMFRTVLTPKGDQVFTIVECTLLDEVREDQGIVTAIAPVSFVEPEPDFHVISDIDDTVLVSHSTRFFRKIWLMLFRNALTRSPFEGVSEFYKALVGVGEPDAQERTIFYVSGSEWNLYDLLVDFFSTRGIPPGPLLLSDARIGLKSMFTAGNTYLEKVNRIGELFKHLTAANFLLIGDSGQKDPEIYMEIASMFPDRVKVIYIRMVGSRRKKRRLEQSIEEAKRLGIEMVAVKTTTEALEHARQNGIVNTSQETTAEQ